MNFHGYEFSWVWICCLNILGCLKKRNTIARACGCRCNACVNVISRNGWNWQGWRTLLSGNFHEFWCKNDGKRKQKNVEVFLLIKFACPTVSRKNELVSFIIVVRLRRDLDIYLLKCETFTETFDLVSELRACEAALLIDITTQYMLKHVEKNQMGWEPLSPIIVEITQKKLHKEIEQVLEIQFSFMDSTPALYSPNLCRSLITWLIAMLVCSSNCIFFYTFVFLLFSPRNRDLPDGTAPSLPQCLRRMATQNRGHGH